MRIRDGKKLGSGINKTMPKYVALGVTNVGPVLG